MTNNCNIGLNSKVSYNPIPLRKAHPRQTLKGYYFIQPKVKSYKDISFGLPSDPRYFISGLGGGGEEEQDSNP